MKLYYICPFQTARSLESEWHGVDLGDDKWLIAVRWRYEAEEMLFAERSDVISLPHPIFEASDEVHPDHIGHLSARMPALQPGHKIHDVIREAQKIHPLLRLRVL